MPAARRIIEEAGYGRLLRPRHPATAVGVQIHEEPRLSPSAGEETLRAGTVVTVEPGIYLPGALACVSRIWRISLPADART